MRQEEHLLSMATPGNYTNIKINRNFFEFQYIIGKGGFGKVINILYNIIYINN
jgi:hypothetical protein